MIRPRRSHRTASSVSDRDQAAVARRIQQLAESGEYEGFNAIIGALTREKEFTSVLIELITRDADFKREITDLCHEMWERKHPRR